MVGADGEAGFDIENAQVAAGEGVVDRDAGETEPNGPNGPGVGAEEVVSRGERAQTTG